MSPRPAFFRRHQYIQDHSRNPAMLELHRTRMLEKLPKNPAYLSVLAECVHDYDQAIAASKAAQRGRYNRGVAQNVKRRKVA